MYELAIEQKKKKKDMQASITHGEEGQVEGGGEPETKKRTTGGSVSKLEPYRIL